MSPIDSLLCASLTGGLPVPNRISTAPLRRTTSGWRRLRVLTQMLSAGFAMGLAGSALAAPVLLISIDGLRPGDVLDANARGIAVPALSALVARGAHASGVVGVVPSFTLPSHVTLVTGVAPARHGVYNNLAFRPQDAGGAPGLELATGIKVATLWDVGSVSV